MIDKFNRPSENSYEDHERLHEEVKHLRRLISMRDAEIGLLKFALSNSNFLLTTRRFLNECTREASPVGLQHDEAVQDAVDVREGS